VNVAFKVKFKLMVFDRYDRAGISPIPRLRSCSGFVYPANLDPRWTIHVTVLTLHESMDVVSAMCS